jgi:hypothetical protein
MEDLLVNKKWQLTGLSVKLSDGTVFPDEYSSLPDYQKDDYWYFKPDHTYTNNDNKKRETCKSPDLIDYGIWYFNYKDSSLMLKSKAPQPPGTNVEYFPTQILQLSKNNMKWESSDPIFGNIVFSCFTVIK